MLIFKSYKYVFFLVQVCYGLIEISLVIYQSFLIDFVEKWVVIVGKFYSYVEVSILFFIDIDNIVIYFESFKIFIVYKIFVLMYLVLL